MEKFVLSSKTIINTYWWNHGSKTKDFTGTIDEWLTFRKVKGTRLRRKNVLPRFKFDFTVGRHTVSLATESNDFEDAAIYVIRMWITYLGDKAMIDTGLREYKINWR